MLASLLHCRSTRVAAVLYVAMLAGVSALGQNTGRVPETATPGVSETGSAGASQSAPTASGIPAGQIGQPLPPEKPPALVDPAGPAVSLQSSEALFNIAVALNACGYDAELEESDPIRSHVRAQVNQALLESALARDVRDQLCAYIQRHRLADTGLDLAQYVSLALYLTPPPDLTPSVELTDMPPDSTQVLGLLPLLRSFAGDIDLHVIWLSNRSSYEDEINRLHEPLTRMILDTNIYLKMPTSTYDGRRFLVVIEPMLAPGATNARVYDTDYVVVTAPSAAPDGQLSIHMQQVRHTYLHYEIEPLLYARTGAIDRLLPILKVVRDAPLDYNFKSDVVALVIECMIRAIEARTMDTGIPVYTPPGEYRRSDAERVERERNAYLQRVAAVRQKSVDQAMAQGYVLTQYFYESLEKFERGPVSLKDSIGEMVYGMDVDGQVRHAKNIEFAQEGSSDVVRHTPRRVAGLDLAELKLAKGDPQGAQEIAQQALDSHSGDAARADYILALSTLSRNDMEGAQRFFSEALRLSKDPRTLAWSHIYLGRILDVQDERDQAVEEYKQALAVRDGQPDTKQAAEKGLRQPFELPHRPAPQDSPEQQNGGDQATPAGGNAVPPK